MRAWLWAAVVLVLLFTLPTAPARAIVNGHPPAADDRRFDAVGAFSTTWRLGLDPTNPQAQDHEWFCTATLVSRRVVLIARHCPDSYPTGTPYAVRFRRNLDGSLGTIEQGPSSFFHALIESWYFPAVGDVALGYLKEAVNHIAPIPILTDGMATLAIGTPFTQAGWGKEGPGLGQGPRRQLLLCANRLTGMDAVYFHFFSAWDPRGPGCGINNNDSGSPVLLEAPTGELRVLAPVNFITAATRLAPYATSRAFAQLARPFRGVDLVPTDIERSAISDARGCLVSGSWVDLRMSVDGIRGPRLGPRLPSWADLPTPYPPFDDDTLFAAGVTLESVAGSADPILFATGSFNTADLPASAGFTVQIPAPTPDGEYQLVLTVDSDGDVAESVEENNRLVAATTIRICSPP